MAKKEEYFDGGSYADKKQAEAQDDGYADAAVASQAESGEEIEVNDQESSNISVEVNEDAAEDEVPIEETYPGPHQVEPTFVIFVPQEDFEARINQEEFSFQKGAAVKVKKEDANDWVDQERGYIK